MVTPYQDEEDQRAWGKWPLQEKEHRMELEVSLFLLKCSPYIVNQALGLLIHPFLGALFHSLFVFPTLQWVFLTDGE